MLWKFHYLGREQRVLAHLVGDAIPDLGTLVRSQPARSQPYTEFFQFSFLTENFYFV